MQEYKNAHVEVYFDQRAQRAAQWSPGGGETNLIFTGSDDLYDFCFEHTKHREEDNGVSHISSVCSESD